MTHFVSDPTGINTKPIDIKAERIIPTYCLVTCVFPIDVVRDRMQQVHSMSLIGPVDMDAIHRCRLVIIPKSPAIQPIVLGQCSPRDLTKLQNDEMKLTHMWSSPLVLTAITEGTIKVVVDLLRVHPSSDWASKLIVRCEGSKNTALETAYFTSGLKTGPFMVVGNPTPDIYELWYENGLPSITLYSNWTKEDEFFDDGELFITK